MNKMIKTNIKEHHSIINFSTYRNVSNILASDNKLLVATARAFFICFIFDLTFKFGSDNQ